MVANYGPMNEFPELREVVKVAFPSNKEDTVVFLVTTEVALTGGSHSDFVAVDWISKKKVKTPKLKDGEMMKYILPPGVAVVEAVWFEGALASVRVYVHPDDVLEYVGENEV